MRYYAHGLASSACEDLCREGLKHSVFADCTPEFNNYLFMRDCIPFAKVYRSRVIGV